AGDRLGPCAPELRHAEEERAADRHTLHLRAVPAAVGRLQPGYAPARVPNFSASAGRDPAHRGSMGRHMRRWFFILGLLGCLSAHAAGPVWAIRGEHNTVYLAGSIHLLKKGDSGLPSAFDS